MYIIVKDIVKIHIILVVLVNFLFSYSVSYRLLVLICPYFSIKYTLSNATSDHPRFVSYPRKMQNVNKHFLKKKYFAVFRVTKEYSRAALFTIIVAMDKPVAFPRRLIISRRKRKGLLRPGATLTSTPLSPSPGRIYPVYVSTYVLSRTPETRYYWITFLIRPLSAASTATHPLSLTVRHPSPTHPLFPLYPRRRRR